MAISTHKTIRSATRRTFIAAAAASAALLAGGAGAQGAYPDKLIRLVVPYPAGGASDTLARVIGEKLQQAWGQPVVVDNKPGAAGMIGAHLVARAPADGYTVLVHNTSLIQQPYMMEKLPYDPMKDFTPVIRTVIAANIFAVPLSSPVKSMKEFVDMAKANPGKLNFGSYGVGSAAHIQGALLNQQTGIDLAHIPYQGSAQMIPNIVSGELSGAFVDVPSAMPHIKSMRPLAVSGPARIPSLPDVPTFTELGYKSFDPVGWHGLLVPVGTPEAVVEKLAAEVTRILNLPEVLAKIEAFGLQPGGGKPADFAKLVKADSEIYGGIIKAANIRIGQ